MCYQVSKLDRIGLEFVADGCTTSSGTTATNISDPAKGTLAEDFLPKQNLLVLCSEKAVYVYSLNHVVQVYDESSPIFLLFCRLL